MMMKTNKIFGQNARRAVVTLVAGISLSMGASAQPASAPKATPAKSANSKVVDPITINLERKKVTLAEGKELLMVAPTMKPGEVFEETATYTNPSKKNTRRVEATLPIPAYTQPILASIRPAGAKASTDGKVFSAIPLKRKITQANGVVIEQDVPLNEYRFLRWAGIELLPEKQFVAAARFKLNDNAPATASR